MNQVILVGRITRKPDTRYKDDMAIARFTVALDRGKDKGADFPNCVAFGKSAELIDKYMDKGSQIGIIGHIGTGSYEKNGSRVYTTDVIVDRVEFIGSGQKNAQKSNERLSEVLEDMTGSPEFKPLDSDSLPF